MMKQLKLFSGRRRPFEPTECDTTTSKKERYFLAHFIYDQMILTIMTDDRQMEVLWLWMRTTLETSLLNFQSIGLPPQLGLAVHNDCLSAFFLNIVLFSLVVCLQLSRVGWASPCVKIEVSSPSTLNFVFTFHEFCCHFTNCWLICFSFSVYNIACERWV